VYVFKNKPALVARVEGMEYLPLGTVAVVFTVGTLRFFGSAACRTTLGLIGKAFSLEELLLPSAEGE